MGEECDHNWVPYKGYSSKAAIPNVDFAFRVTKVKCIECGEVKKVD